MLAHCIFATLFSTAERAVFSLTRSILNITSARVSPRPTSFHALLRSQIATGSHKPSILRSQIATSSSHGGRRYLPYVFTEFGALMAANVLNSSQAVKMSLYVIRAFVKSRDELAANSAIVKRLAQIALPQIAKSLNRPVAKCFSFLWKNQ